MVLSQLLCAFMGILPDDSTIIKREASFAASACLSFTNQAIIYLGNRPSTFDIGIQDDDVLNYLIIYKPTPQAVLSDMSRLKAVKLSRDADWNISFAISVPLST